MIDNKIQYLFKSDDQEVELTTPKELVAEFGLSYKQMLIGHLKFNKGLWTFEYSQQFKEQNKMNTIVGFPKKDKVYQSYILFPFFAGRIPSIQRLKLQNIISDNATKDEVSLLKIFGKQSITNPYHLIPQS